MTSGGRGAGKAGGGEPASWWVGRERSAGASGCSRAAQLRGRVARPRRRAPGCPPAFPGAQLRREAAVRRCTVTSGERSEDPLRSRREPGESPNDASSDFAGCSFLCVCPALLQGENRLLHSPWKHLALVTVVKEIQIFSNAPHELERDTPSEFGESDVLYNKICSWCTGYFCHSRVGCHAFNLWCCSDFNE